MAHRPGSALVFLAAVISFEAGCAGTPEITSFPDATATRALTRTAEPTGGAAQSPAPAPKSPVASATTGTAAPQATQQAPAWRVANKLTGPGIGTLVAFDAGYVMSGFRREVFFSPNGSDWQRVELPWTTDMNNGVEMDAQPLTISVSDRRAVAAGYADKEPCEESSGDGGPPPCQRRPVSWVTENGVDWVASGVGDILVEPFSYQEFLGIWPVAGGWDAALGQARIISEESALAHSEDGLRWQELAPVPGSAAGEAPAGYVGGVGTPDGQRIIWTFDEADVRVRLWRAEGTGWTMLGDLDPEVAITASLGPSQPGQPWLIGGHDWGSELPRLWVSTDGIEFEEATLPRGSEADAGITSIVRWDGGYLALAGDGSAPAAVWSSADGEEWAPEPTFTESWPYLEQLVVGPSNLAAVHGSGPDGGDDLYAKTILLRE